MLDNTGNNVVKSRYVSGYRRFSERPLLDFETLC